MNNCNFIGRLTKDPELKATDPDTYNKYLEDTFVKGRAGYVKITAPKNKEG